MHVWYRNNFSVLQKGATRVDEGSDEEDEEEFELDDDDFEGEPFSSPINLMFTEKICFILLSTRFFDKVC